MPTWSNAGSLPPGSLPRNISAKSSAIAIFGPSPSFLEENENPTPTPRRWRNMKLSRSQPSTKLGTPSALRSSYESTNCAITYLVLGNAGLPAIGLPECFAIAHWDVLSWPTSLRRSSVPVLVVSLLCIFRNVDCQHDSEDQDVILPCRGLHSVRVTQRNPPF